MQSYMHPGLQFLWAPGRTDRQTGGRVTWRVGFGGVAQVQVDEVDKEGVRCPVCMGIHPLVRATCLPFVIHRPIQPSILGGRSTRYTPES